ncbi:DHA2 family efflux MFS transporter permease subunit [Allopusillimonas soli]|uniref:DHA2 family efflux MFS transporter permease subunit n=1 Tax=Allopusillimonas soli TaxID=659016 RepID=A0A853FD94_9BURK|nr:DHA2 family efflux MFS transporter permease subunit [Allopusillimonas soli]NYT37612.1 DHA2 family efflux MFS transporter permease subunit [Allopusillimonas soli]TEA74425.1 DHA2 family efflux MFS transporter permease subunit [Allopusillimonas soli]
MIPLIVGCALFMQMLDSTVVATALPVMAQALDTTVVRMNVAITSYLLAVAVFVPVSGWAADRFGARKVFLAAILLFTLSSIACAASQTIGQLVVSRVIQGLAGAMMVPVGRIIMLRKVPKTELIKAMAFLSLPALLGPMIGPPVGGFLVTYASWHWIFLINVPVGILGIALVRHYIRDDYPVEPLPMDWLGFVLSGISLATLVSGFEAVGHGSLPPVQLALLLATGVITGLLYIWHARRIDHPIIDLSLLRVRSFAISTLGGNLCRFAIGAAPFLLAILLQVGFGLSPFSAGLITFTGAVGSMAMKLVATRVLNRWGFRRVLIVNALLTGFFVALCALFRADTPVWLMVAVLIAGGFFRSLQFTAVNTLTYADLGPEAMSRASSFSAMAQQLGISLGVACAAVTLNLSMKLRGNDTLDLVDIMTGFIVIGLIAAASVFSFMRLPANAGAQLHGRK